MRNVSYELKDYGRSRSGLGLRWALPHSHPLFGKLDELQRRRNLNASGFQLIGSLLYRSLAELDTLDA